MPSGCITFPSWTEKEGEGMEEEDATIEVHNRRASVIYTVTNLMTIDRTGAFGRQEALPISFVNSHVRPLTRFEFLCQSNERSEPDRPRLARFCVTYVAEQKRGRPIRSSPLLPLHFLS